jgi:hypothetical protein
MSTSQVGALYSQLLNEDQTIDLSLKTPPDYTYAHELGLYLFGPDMTYMTTWDPEAGPRAASRYGPVTEQEIVYTASSTETFAFVVLNHANLADLQYNLSATIDGRPLDVPRRGYVDPYNRNSQYSFTADANQWSVLASSYISGGGQYDLKLLSNALSTNPVAMKRVTRDDRSGVIAINGWELEAGQTAMFANLSYFLGRSDFVVHAATAATDFGPIGHYESAEFGLDEIAFVYHVGLTTGDHLELTLAYDQGNWSSDVDLALLIFEPGEALSASPVATIELTVIEGVTHETGVGEFLADNTGTYGFVLVNRGPVGPMGFTLGAFRRSVVNYPPMYPAILKATSTSDSITIHWAPNQESDFKKYEIYLSNNDINQGDRIDTISSQTAGKYTITRLDPGHEYWVTVVVYDTEGLSAGSNPYGISTEKLPLYAEPMLWVIILTIVIAAVAIIGIDRFIKRQKAVGVAASEAGAAVAAEMPGGEVEGVEEEEIRPSRRERRGPEDEATRDRRDAIDFMRTMMGDEEDTVEE